MPKERSALRLPLLSDEAKGTGCAISAAIKPARTLAADMGKIILRQNQERTWSAVCFP
jgi:hypothetical protein